MESTELRAIGYLKRLVGRIKQIVRLDVIQVKVTIGQRVNKVLSFLDCQRAQRVIRSIQRWLTGRGVSTIPFYIGKQLPGQDGHCASDPGDHEDSLRPERSRCGLTSGASGVPKGYH